MAQRSKIVRRFIHSGPVLAMLIVAVALAFAFLGRGRWRPSAAPRDLPAAGIPAGSLVESLDRDGLTPMARAARDDDTESIAGLVRAGAVIDRRSGRNGWTPLEHAIHKDARRAVAALLAAGADPNARGASGRPPLFAAVTAGDAELVAMLLAAGGDPRATDEDGTNALLLAVEGGFLADVDRAGSLLGSCQDEIVSQLLADAPDLELPPGWESRFARSLARLRGCRGVLARIDGPRPGSP